MVPDPQPQSTDRSRPGEPPAGATPLRWRRRWTISLVVAAGLLAMLTLVVAANYVFVELRLIVWNGEIRLSWVIFGALGLGFLLGLLTPRLPR